MPFELPQLNYSHDALEPHIDQKTMEIHHWKHHACYTSKLNAALEGTEHAEKSIEELMKSMDMENSDLRNNGEDILITVFFGIQCLQMQEVCPQVL